MNDIKFACPHCRQHIQCDAIHSGRTIACPNCHASLRIPPMAASDSKLAEAEMLSPPPGKTQPIQQPHPDSDTAAPVPREPATPRQRSGKEKAAMTKTLAEPESPLNKEKAADTPQVNKLKTTLQPSAPAQAASPVPPSSGKSQLNLLKSPEPGQPEEKSKSSPVRMAVPPARAPGKPTKEQSIHCICPVCQSELRLPASPDEEELNQAPRAAELVRKGASSTPGSPTPPSAKNKPPPSRQTTQKAQAARPGGEMKPRLEYVLHGQLPSAPASHPPSPDDEP